jgi:hypothetical protein
MCVPSPKCILWISYQGQGHSCHFCVPYADHLVLVFRQSEIIYVKGFVNCKTLQFSASYLTVFLFHCQEV